MNKNFYKSKTIWGFGIAVLGTLGTTVGLLEPSMYLSVIETVAVGLGLYGLRAAQG